jgi:hypothetical protein
VFPAWIKAAKSTVFSHIFIDFILALFVVAFHAIDDKLRAYEVGPLDAFYLGFG